MPLPKVNSLQDASLDEILSRAKELRGITINELIGREHKAIPNKGILGNYIEEYGFGISNNNEAEPDFKKEQIELKVVPLVKFKGKDNYRIKERTKICSLNYNTISAQQWSDSDAKHKLNRILFIFYAYNTTHPGLSEIVNYHLYELGVQGADETILSGDWIKIHEEIVACRAHLLSERLTKVLAASRAGTGGGKDDVIIKHCDPDRKVSRRAFSLKPAFARVIWNEISSKEKEPYVRLQDKYELGSSDDVERILLEKVSTLQGKTLAAIQEEYGLKAVKGKGTAAQIVRAALGFKGNRPIKELEQLGITVKTVPVNLKNGKLWEAMSFPYQPLKEIEQEEVFEETELYEHIQGILILPVYRETKERDIENEVVGRPFIWYPDNDQLTVIKKEWQYYRRAISQGVTTYKKYYTSKSGYKVITSLPKESETEIIHIRPHGRDGSDLDPSMPPSDEISKQSFWLNKAFLRKLIWEHKDL